MATTCISKHKGDAIFGIDLENVDHSLSAPRASRVLGVLYQCGPASELVAELTIGDRLGQIVVLNLLQHQVQFRAFEFHGPGFEVVGVSQAQCLMFTGLGQITEPGPTGDPPCWKDTVSIRHAPYQADPLGMHHPDAAEIISEGFPPTEPLAFIAAAIEQLQQPRSEWPAQFFWQITHIELKKELKRLAAPPAIGPSMFHTDPRHS